MKNPGGEQAFDEYFKKVYGERWPLIRQALLQDDAKVGRRNLFCQDENVSDFPGIGASFPLVPHCHEITDAFDLSQWEKSLLPFYRMDPASIVAGRALEMAAGDRVLDMCAAPGGKTLVLLEALFLAEQKQWDLSGELVANEMSAKRRFRLMSVLKRYLPKDVRSRVKVTGWDGSLFGRKQPESFDKVLLDAPCSGERGVINKASDLQMWKEKRSKNFGVRQYALLASAFDTLKPGGRLIYSTCSLSPHENDQVIAKLFKRKADQFTVINSSCPVGFESTTHGFQALPDQQGWGPIYFCSIQKNE